MSTIEERNAARAQRNMDRNAVIQQDNRINDACDIENRIRELETRSAMLESRVEALENVIARQTMAQQEEVKPRLAVSQTPESVVVDNAVLDNRVHVDVSGAIRNRNAALGVEGFRWNETYRSAHNRATKMEIVAYVEGLQGHGIQRAQLLKKIYTFFDNHRAISRQSAVRTAQRRTSNRRNARRHAKKDRRLEAFQLHQIRLQESYLGGEALLQPGYMSDEETDDEYEGEVGKRVLVWKPHWRNKKANELLRLLDELAPPSDATRLVKVFGGVRVVALSSDEERQLDGWTAV